jgi:hypothetical protein
MKENHGLAIQAWYPDNSIEAVARLEVECHHFISGHTIEPAIGPKAQAPRLPKPDMTAGDENTNKMPIRSVIFADGRHSISGTERMLAAYDNIAVRGDRKVEWTELSISYLPCRQYQAVGAERQNGVVTFAVWTDPGREKTRIIGTKRKSARKRNDVRRKDKFACAVELARKRHNGALAAQTDIITAVRPKIAAARV